nr:histidine kinase [uncultured Sphingobacterium sp.]
MKRFLSTYFRAYLFAFLLFAIILSSEVQFTSDYVLGSICDFFLSIFPRSLIYSIPVAFLMWYCGQFDFQKPKLNRLIQIVGFLLIGVAVTVLEKLLEFYLGTWNVKESFGLFLTSRFFPTWLGLNIYSIIYGAVTVSISNMRRNVLLQEQLQTASINAIKAQLEHHFLFNNLNTLYSLIDDTNPKALNFLHNLSELYRYVLKNADNQTVSLVEELLIVEKFIKMTQERYGSNLIVSINYSHQLDGKAVIPPLSIYNLVENVIKHNIIDDSHRVRCTIDLTSQFVVVSNNMFGKRYSYTKENSGIGLASLRKIYAMLSTTKVEVDIIDNFFIVKVPILQSHQTNGKIKLIAYENCSR